MTTFGELLKRYEDLTKASLEALDDGGDGEPDSTRAAVLAQLATAAATAATAVAAVRTPVVGGASLVPVRRHAGLGAERVPVRLPRRAPRFDRRRGGRRRGSIADAVAEVRHRNPGMAAAAIAARVGCSERHVRRFLSPTA